MPSLYTHQAENVRRTWLLLGAFVVLIAALGWVFSAYWGNALVFPIVLAFAILGSFFSYWYADRLVVAVTRARPVAKRDDPELYRLVENLSIAAGLPTPRIYLIDDPAPNALATGRNAQKALVAVTRGLRERLEEPELEGVLAHELAHIGNRDMVVATVAAVLAGVIVTLAHVFTRASFSTGGRRSRGRGSGALLAIGVLAAIILAPLAATLLRLAISRRREFLADATGALLTRYPEGLARALEKIAATPLPMRHAPEMTAHLWISEPQHRHREPGFLGRLFLTHPPIAERVKRLRGVSA